MKSQNQILALGEAKRFDSLKFPLSKVHIKEGFNVSETHEEFRARVDGIKAFRLAGGKLPPVMVKARDEGGVWMVAGHARLQSETELAAENLVPPDPKDGVHYIEGKLTDAPWDECALMRWTSEQGARIHTPLQQAEILADQIALGWTVEQIVKKTGNIGVKADQIRNLIKLGQAPQATKNLVAEGKVSASEAVREIRKHGEGATEVLRERVATGKRNRTDKRRLDWLMESGAVIKHGGRMDMSKPDLPSERGYWLDWFDNDGHPFATPDVLRSQNKAYADGRAAIDAAMDAAGEGVS